MAKFSLFLLAFSLSFIISCNKQQQAEQVPPPTAKDATAKSPEKLPGASVVRDDLKNKNYSKAVEGLLVLRGFAANNELWAEYRELSAEVGQALATAAPTDEDAAKALAKYRLAAYGR